MDTAELQDKIFAFVEAAKGKKKLKEKDIIKGVSQAESVEKDEVKKAMRAMIDVGRLMYSYGGGASSVEIPSEEYLKEKGML
jgi:hypothetical protein